MVVNFKKIGIVVLVLFLLFGILPIVEEIRWQLRRGDVKKNFIGTKIALDIYFDLCGKYPTTEEGLKLLLKPSSCYKNAVLKEDALKNGHGIEFVYVSDGKQFRLISLNKEGYLETDTSK